jgi:hypothetical protein
LYTASLELQIFLRIGIEESIGIELLQNGFSGHIIASRTIMMLAVLVKVMMFTTFRLCTLQLLDNYYEEVPWRMTEPRECLGMAFEVRLLYDFFYKVQRD